MPDPVFTRAIVIVLDSVGIGELPDAPAYGDQGSNTLGNIARRVPLHVPALVSLGLDRLVPALAGRNGLPFEGVAGAYGRMAEHLGNNNVDLEKTPLTLGVPLIVDAKNERFTGPDAARANKMLTREYRAPYTVPSIA